MKYRQALPQLNGKQCLTDSGLETTLVFTEGMELPGFAAITMMTTDENREYLRQYFDAHIRRALDHGVGFILESPTWRSSRGWAETVGYSEAELEQLDVQSIGLLAELRAQYETPATPIVISGCVGPRGDGYVADAKMTGDEARDYHLRQIALFADAGVDCVTAMTINYVEEAIGIVLAAQAAQVPSVISFTVETDGRLVTGETLQQAIEQVDAATGGGPAYYMINCAHPEHFADVLDPNAAWVKRIGGIRANASKCSHAELDNSEELDIGNPDELGRAYKTLTTALPQITVVGGCCGTDIRHIDAIVQYQYGDSAQVDRSVA